MFMVQIGSATHVSYSEFHLVEFWRYSHFSNLNVLQSALAVPRCSRRRHAAQLVQIVQICEAQDRSFQASVQAN